MTIVYRRPKNSEKPIPDRHTLLELDGLIKAVDILACSIMNRLRRYDENDFTVFFNELGSFKVYKVWQPSDDCSDDSGWDWVQADKEDMK